MKHLNRDQALVLLDECDDLSRRLRAADTNLRALTSFDARGYSTSSRLDGGSGSGPSMSVVDEYGNRETMSATSVEASALAPNPIRDAHRALCTGVEKARRAMLDALVTYNRTLPSASVR